MDDVYYGTRFRQKYFFSQFGKKHKYKVALCLNVDGFNPFGMRSQYSTWPIVLKVG